MSFYVRSSTYILLHHASPTTVKPHGRCEKGAFTENGCGCWMVKKGWRCQLRRDASSLGQCLVGPRKHFHAMFSDISGGMFMDVHLFMMLNHVESPSLLVNSPASCLKHVEALSLAMFVACTTPSIRPHTAQYRLVKSQTPRIGCRDMAGNMDRGSPHLQHV